MLCSVACRFLCLLPTKRLNLMLEHNHPTPVKPQRVVILGASGFVARDLVRHLNDQLIDYRAIGSDEIDLLHPACVSLLQAAVRKGDALVITACLTPDKGRDVGTLMKNLAMAQHLAAFIEVAALSQVIHISSNAVYDDRDSPIREASKREPTDLYSLMHIARERIMGFATAKSETPLCLLCPCAIYGAEDTHNSYGPNRFFRTAIKDRKITLFGRGEETRDHVYIKDVTRLIGHCLTHRSEGTLNAVSGASYAFWEVAAKVAHLCGPGVRIEHLPQGGPVTHQSFDVADRIKAFPKFAPITLDDSFAEVFRQIGG